MVDFLAVIVLFLTIYAMDRIKDTYGKWLKRALVAGSFAVVANIFVAVSVNSAMAAVAYCAYFSAIDFILYFLYGFCMLYTEHVDIFKKTHKIICALMIIDTVSIYANFIFGHLFTSMKIRTMPA